MSFWFANVGVTFLLCTFLAGIVIPQILLIAFRKRLFDIQDERKIHKGVVPRLGGIAFTPVIFFTIFFMLGVDLMLGHAEILSEVGRESRPVFFGFCSITILYLIGMADDLIGVKYRAKFAAQILCSILIIAGGVYIGDLHDIFGINRLPVWIGYLATSLAIVFIINAINLIDGIDGLASGLCSIVCLYYGIIFYMFGYYAYSMLSFATLGVLIPFFYYNVFGKVERHKKIFMGDTGSLTLGGLIAVFAILIRKELLIPIMCAIFLVEDLSVMLQVAYFKYTKKKTGTGRRIFKMTPLHHHFQVQGNSGVDALIQRPIRAVPESKIVMRFCIVAIFLAALTFVTLKIR